MHHEYGRLTLATAGLLLYNNAFMNVHYNYMPCVFTFTCVLQSPATRSRRLKAVGPGIYDRKFEHLPAGNVTIDSVFASYKYFHHVEDQLRADLRFRADILATARRWLTRQTPHRWKDANFSRVLVHVRRTDYLGPGHARDGMPQPTADYFRRSMSVFSGCLDRVQFVVLSDAIAMSSAGECPLE